MTRIIRATAAALVFAALQTHAAELVRDRQLIETVPFQGVALEMAPKQAFEHLRSLGYQAGNIDTFEDWDTDGIEFVRGTYGGDDGESRITLSRKNGRLTHMTEMWNRPRNKFRAPLLISDARGHFGIAADDPKCVANGEFAGNCRVQDAENPNDVDLVYGLQILPGMLNRYIESKKSYRE